MFLLIFTGIVGGIFFPDFFATGKDAVPWIFGVMVFFLALKNSFSDLKRVVLYPLPLAVILLSLHVASPFFAYAAGSFIYGSTAPFTTGLVLAAAIPTGITSVIWVSAGRGNLPLALTTVSMDSL